MRRDDLIFLTGDAHREFERILDFCKEYETTTDDVQVILGDAGINRFLDSRDEQLKQELGQLPVTLFFVYGNHEGRPAELPGYEEMWWHGGVVLTVWTNIIGYPAVLRG